MVRRYSFLVIFLALLVPLAWWSSHEEIANAHAVSAPAVVFQQEAGLDASDLTSFAEHPSELSQRRKLIEVIDRLVAYEHYYRSVYGHYTKLLTRLGYPVPSDLAEIYDIRVTEASRERLVITALSESEGRTRDLVTIDQDYAVRASFALPQPRPEYLKGLALKQLRALRDAPTGQAIEEQGVFHGFFRYELKRDSQDRKVAFAVGLKAPVAGVQLELGPGDSELADQDDAYELDVTRTGQKPVGNVMSTLEEAYLAQRIFRGEVGRYAKNWSELSRIASFRFEDKAKFGQEGRVPFGDAGSVLEIDAAVSAEVERVGQESARAPSSSLQPLEIEPISPDLNK